MTEVVAGLMMMSGGGLMLGSAFHLMRHSGPNSAELVAALPFTPVPPADPDLDALLASID